jgi:hypothetical protein
LHFPAPVVRKPDIIELAFECGYIFFRGNGGMLPGVQCVLFGGQPKTVEPHRVQYIETLQSLEPAVDITGDISEGMANMQAGTAGIGKHIKYITFRA